ncbi:hypothetical protein K488DRAFT_18270, partial [Vararia minispora EC-137]
AVVVWEWLISLETERQIIWKSPWTLVKCAYFFCRYWVLLITPYDLWVFVINHSQETCQKIYKTPPALGIFNMFAGEAILLLRTWAFFNRNNRVLVGLSLLLAGVLAYQLWVAGLSSYRLFCERPNPYVSIVTVLTRSPKLAPLFFDTLVTGMVIVKAWIRCRRHGPSSRIIQIFVREGVFYYLMISLANAVNGIFYVQSLKTISGIMVPFSVLLGPILACRLV